jgi:hypothetical protein
VTIQAVHFDIPADIQLALDRGDLIRFGGVVRDSMGQIVQHLKEADGRGAVGRFAADLKNPWVIAVAGLGVLAIGGGITYYTARKRKQIWEALQSYGSSWQAYLTAIRDGDMNAEIIDKLISDLDAAENHFDEQPEKLVGVAVGYTRALAEVNSVELDGLLLQGRVPENDAVVDLRRHLEAQRRIFTKAA